MKRFQADFMICGTCYVMAEDEDTARDKINALVGRNASVQLGCDDFLLDDDGSFISPVFTPQGDIIDIEESGF